jgi:DNA-binding transcriptional regulator/RsmH inhibitor MraZ
MEKKNSMENMHIKDLFVYQRECTEQIAEATKKLDMYSMLQQELNKEIQVRKNEYEMDKDL